MAEKNHQPINEKKREMNLNKFYESRIKQSNKQTSHKIKNLSKPKQKLIKYTK